MQESDNMIKKNGLPYYSSNVHDSKCYSCNEVDIFKNSDKNAYQMFEFLCLNKQTDTFAHESSTFVPHGNKFFPKS